jgi:glycosyltransferase involved in cell wall biosynthesis
MPERLAIAIPFHAGLEYLAEALASVRAQRDGDWRLLVLDDSGVDGGARALVEGLGDARVCYRANARNLGMVASWNRCLDESEGELVTLVHADDRLLPDYVSEMKRLAAAHPAAAALFCPAETIDARGARRFSLQDDVKRLLVPRGPGDVLLHGEAGLRALMRGNFVVCPTLCWRRAVLGARRFEARWRQVQDLELLARLLLAGETLAGGRRAAYAYRRHAANATAQQTASLVRFEEEFELFELVADAAQARGWRRAERTSRAKTILRLHLGWRVFGALARLRWSEAGRYTRFLLGRRPRARSP